jgi:hypothetical protein
LSADPTDHASCTLSFQSLFALVLYAVPMQIYGCTAPEEFTLFSFFHSGFMVESCQMLYGFCMLKG